MTSSAPPSPRFDAETLRFLPWVVAVAFFMQTLDTTILNTALPAMAESLKANPLQMQSVIISYMLTVALLIPASGSAADKFGTRRVFLFAIFLFSLGSLFCALAPTLPLLTASRVVQGIGGALLVPVGRLSVLRAYPRDQLVQILSFISIPGLLGPLVGPTLGGFLVDYASWHWIFFINIPVGVVGALAALRYMPDGVKPDSPIKFDWTGFFLFGVSMCIITLALEGAGELHFSYTATVTLLAAGCISLAGYCFHALKTEDPLFSPKLFHTRNFAVGITGNLFARLGNGAMPFLTPLLLQVGLGFSPLKAGMTMIPMTLGAMFAKNLIRGLIKRAGYRRLLTGNTLMLGVLIACFSLINHDMPYLILVGFFFIFGTVNSIQFTAMNTVTLLDIPDRHAGSGNGLLSVVMQLSMGMGVACAAAILDEFSVRTAGTGIMEAFKYTYWCLGLLTVLSSAIFLHLGRSVTEQGEKTRD